MAKPLDSFEFQDEVPFGIALAVREKIAECLEHYPAVPSPDVLYDLKGHTAGQAISSRNQIRLNLALLKDSRYSDDMLNDTVPHEVAHIVVRFHFPLARSHGWEWQTVMNKFGVPATRCHNYETEAARTRKATSRPYPYHCQCQTHWMTKLIHGRIQKGREYSCRDCKGILSEGELQE